MRTGFWRPADEIIASGRSPDQRARDAERDRRAAELVQERCLAEIVDGGVTESVTAIEIASS